MNVKFSAGEFAKLCGVSKQTLIFYDKEDVIRPKFKDKNNGYRYYGADQLEQMDCILILREMGFSLKEIKEHMKNRNPKNSLQMLKKQEEAIGEKIKELEEIKTRIEKRAASLQKFYSQDTSFRIDYMPQQLLAVEKVKKPSGLLEVDIALKFLMQKVKNGGMGNFYQVGDIVPLESLNTRNFLNFKFAFLPADYLDESIPSLIKPEGHYAVSFHTGKYETMGETYAKMIEKIEKSGFSLSGDSYEFCVLDSLTTSSPENYCTQIQIPVTSM